MVAERKDIKVKYIEVAKMKLDGSKERIGRAKK